MNKFLFPIFSLFLILGVACTPKATSKLATEQVSPVPTEKSLLWKIEGKELTQPSYLYGTIHMIDKDDFFLTDSTLAVFDRAKKVVFEINMEEMSDMSAMFSMVGKIMMNDGTTLKDLLSEADYKLVSDHFSGMGLPMMMLERIKPMFLSAMASGDMDFTAPMPEGGGMGGDIKSYEMEFMEMAKSKNKGMDGLETIDYQMSVFDSIPYTDQANMLVTSVRSGENGEADEMTKMVEIYKQQDIVAMQSMFKEDSEGIGKYEDIFLKNRNRNWIPVMVKMATEAPTFFAVGAGHLGGENGVIALLREAGYNVSAVMSKPVKVTSGTKL